MTSLKDLFKKTKKATKETTDKILDADLEETATKVAEATGKTTKKATIGLVKLIIWGIVIVIHVFVLYVVFEIIYNPIWCKGKNTEIFDNSIVFKSLNKREFRELEKQWFSKSCYYYVNPIGFSDEEAEEISNTRKFQLWKQTFRYHPQK